jgi:hypothetical protein
MDLFHIFSSLVVPRWVKLTVSCLLFSLLVINVTIAFLGIVGSGPKERWLEAAVYLFGVLLPILLLVFVVLNVDGGPGALKLKTFEYMTVTIPDSLKSIAEIPNGYYPVSKIKAQRTKSTVSVQSNQYRDSCLADYIVDFKDRPTDILLQAGQKGKRSEASSVGTVENRRIHLTLELNVKKANVAVYVPAAQAEWAAGLIPRIEDFDSLLKKRAFSLEHFRQLFPHTMKGAEAENYIINPSLFFHQKGDAFFYGVVLVKLLDNRFLTTPQEKLYFAQDLMFMIKAFYNEQRELFLKR